MKISYYLFALLIGIGLTIHLAMNGKVGAVLDNARVGNAFFWCIGAVTAVAVGISGWHTNALAAIKEVNPLLLFAGAIGACLVFGIAFLMPRIGAAKFTLIMLAGQILGGLVLSQFGWLGSPKDPISLRSAIGAIVMFAGVILATI